jgi:hypothetical protein
MVLWKLSQCIAFPGRRKRNDGLRMRKRPRARSLGVIPTVRSPRFPERFSFADRDPWRGKPRDGSPAFREEGRGVAGAAKYPASPTRTLVERSWNRHIRRWLECSLLKGIARKVGPVRKHALRNPRAERPRSHRRHAGGGGLDGAGHQGAEPLRLPRRRRSRAPIPGRPCRLRPLCRWQGPRHRRGQESRHHALRRRRPIHPLLPRQEMDPSTLGRSAPVHL